MNIKLKNNVLLISSSFLLLLQFYQIIEAFQYLQFLLIWRISLYAYITLFLCGLGYYIGFFYVDNSRSLNKSKKEKEKIIIFLEMVLFSGIASEFILFMGAYYVLYTGVSLLKLQIDYATFTYLFLLICGLFFLLISRKIGYIVCMQLSFYLIDCLARIGNWDNILFRAKAMWLLLLMFVVVWSILCHRRVMLEHWKITTRKELYYCLGISVVIGFLMYYFRL